MLESTRAVLAAAGLLVVALILIMLPLVPWVNRGRCSKCKRFFAMSRTGVHRRGEGWEEWACSYCAHREWRLVRGGIYWDSGGNEGNGDGNGGNGD